VTFALLDNFNTIPGSTYFVGILVTVNRNFLIQNLNLAEDDVRQWGTFVLQIYVPNPVDQYCTFFSQNLYQPNVVIFNPAPYLGTLNIRVGLYTPVRSLPIQAAIWTES
jgi:hypothetical protein